MKIVTRVIARRPGTEVRTIFVFATVRRAGRARKTVDTGFSRSTDAVVTASEKQWRNTGTASVGTSDVPLGIRI